MAPGWPLLGGALEVWLRAWSATGGSDWVGADYTITDQPIGPPTPRIQTYPRGNVSQSRPVFAWLPSTGALGYVVNVERKIAIDHRVYDNPPPYDPPVE